MAGFDLNSVTPERAEWKGSTRDNPTVAWLSESWRNDEAKQVRIPADQARALVNLLYAATRELSCGVSVRVVVDNREYSTSKELWDQVEKLGKRQIVVKFRGKDKTNRPRKGATETPVSE